MPLVLLVLLVPTLGFLIWGSIKFVDRHNPENTPGLAMVAAFFMAPALAVGGLTFAALPLVVLAMLFVNYYQLTAVQTAIALVMIAAASTAIDVLLAALV